VLLAAKSGSENSLDNEKTRTGLRAQTVLRRMPFSRLRLLGVSQGEKAKAKGRDASSVKTAIIVLDKNTIYRSLFLVSTVPAYSTPS
jgi:hypothetical protein